MSFVSKYPMTSAYAAYAALRLAEELAETRRAPACVTPHQYLDEDYLATNLETLGRILDRGNTLSSERLAQLFKEWQEWCEFDRAELARERNNWFYRTAKRLRGQVILSEKGRA